MRLWPDKSRRAARASSAQPTRVLLFTDTLGDVNGVSRFIRNIADRALATGRDLRVCTSTRLEIPDRPNLENFAPLAACPMPRYANLELVLPPPLAMLRAAKRFRPHAIHISTPGPVGIVGRIAAWRIGVPALGVYHTDFPAYIERLFGQPAYTRIARHAMRAFYSRFALVFTRSDEYRAPLEELGLPPERLESLRPGIDVDAFHPRHRNTLVWGRLRDAHDRQLEPADVRVLYCGRVSVEKNLPLLARVWPIVWREAAAQGVSARLTVVGDGPYRDELAATLEAEAADFLGFRHGDELATIYASSDLFVFPSVTDTLGQAVMEALASGVPAIVSDRGGPREVVADGRTGLVVDGSDEDAWAEAALALVLDEGRRRTMARAAHDSMRDRGIGATFEQFWERHERARHEHAAR